MLKLSVQLPAFACVEWSWSVHHLIQFLYKHDIKMNWNNIYLCKIAIGCPSLWIGFLLPLFYGLIFQSISITHKQFLKSVSLIWFTFIHVLINVNSVFFVSAKLIFSIPVSYTHLDVYKRQKVHNKDTPEAQDIQASHWYRCRNIFKSTSLQNSLSSMIWARLTSC